MESPLQVIISKINNSTCESKKASAIMSELQYSDVMKHKLNKNAMILISKLVFVPILIIGHESLLLIKTLQSQVHLPSKNGISRRVGSVSPKNTIFNIKI